MIDTSLVADKAVTTWLLPAVRRQVPGVSGKQQFHRDQAILMKFAWPSDSCTLCDRSVTTWLLPAVQYQVSGVSNMGCRERAIQPCKHQCDNVTAAVVCRRVADRATETSALASACRGAEGQLKREQQLDKFPSH